MVWLGLGFSFLWEKVPARLVGSLLSFILHFSVGEKLCVVLLDPSMAVVSRLLASEEQGKVVNQCEEILILKRIVDMNSNINQFVYILYTVLKREETMNNPTLDKPSMKIMKGRPAKYISPYNYITRFDV